MRLVLLPITLLSTLALSGCAQPGCDSDLDCVAEGESETSTTEATGDGDGDGDETTTGDGDGDGDETTTGDGDGDETTTGDGDCEPGEVSDSVSLASSLPLPPGAATWSCTVLGVDLVATGGEVDFDCVDLDNPEPVVYVLDLNVSLSTEDLALSLPFQPDQQVGMVTYYDDFGPGYTSFVIRGADNELLLVRVDGDGAEPWIADEGWAAPLGPISLEPTTCVEGSQTQQFVIVEGEGLAEPVSIRSSTAGDVSLDAGDFAVRVNYATDNPDVDGGCNTCVNYTILPKQG